MKGGLLPPSALSPMIFRAFEDPGSACMQQSLHDLPSLLLPLQEIAAPLCKAWGRLVGFHSFAYNNSNNHDNKMMMGKMDVPGFVEM